jgi:membrane protein DedA with SNARE-associated domain
MPLGSFSFFTGLGAGIWTAILAAVGFWLGRTAGDISYSELVHRGKAFIDGNLVWVLAAVAVLVVVHVAVSKFIMKGTRVREKRDPAGAVVIDRGVSPCEI